jgi:predicted transcriptional regulator
VAARSFCNWIPRAERSTPTAFALLLIVTAAEMGDSGAIMVGRPRRPPKGRSMNDDPETLLTMTADVVAAYVSNKSLSVSDLPALIASVHGALAGLDGTSAAQSPVVNDVPAISIKASIKPDAIACITCGKKFKMLKRHLTTDHQMTVAEYRAKWKLPDTYPVVAPDYAEKRRTLALKIGLGRKPGGRGKAK